MSKQSKFPWQSNSFSSREKGERGISHEDHSSLLEEAKSISSDLPALLLAAQRVAATVAQGVHGRRRSGQGESFWQYRTYQYEDSRTKIDWRRSAKSNALFVRETEWEAAQSLWLWCDSSPSMAYPSNKSLEQKGKVADLLLLALASLSLQAGEHVGVINNNFSTTRTKGNNPKSLPYLARALLQNHHTWKEGANDVDRFLDFIQSTPRYSHIILASDFLEEKEVFAQRLKGLVDRNINATFLCICDPAERSLPFKGRVRFTGMKQEAPLLLRKIQTIRGEYQSNRVAHFDHLAKLVRHQGWHWFDHNTMSSATDMLLRLHMSLDQSSNRKKR